LAAKTRAVLPQNSSRGGWLFGISYDFMLWMLGPVTPMQWMLGRPIIIGGASQGLLAAHLLYGLALGLCFPYAHRLVQRKGAKFPIS
jgi:hypothetical protein